MLERRLTQDFEITPGQAELRGLRNLARQVFLDRNAGGFAIGGDQMRRRSRTDGRPHLRNAIQAARKARDALALGNLDNFERWRAEARMHLAHARTALRAPFLERVSKTLIRPPERRGGRPSHTERARKWADDFDRRRAESRFLHDEDVVDEIAAEYSKTHVAVDAAYVSSEINKVRGNRR